MGGRINFSERAPRSSALHMPPRITFHWSTSNRFHSSSSKKTLHKGVGQPILVFLRRPTPLTHQHPVNVSPSKHPEDIPSGCVIKLWPKRTRVTHGNDHSFLSLIAETFSLLFQFCQFGRNHARTPQQIEGCTLRIVDLPGDGSGKPQTRLRVPRAQCLSHGVFIIRAKSGLVEKLSENSCLRLEDGVHAWGRDLRPLPDRLDGHSRIAFALQQLSGSLDDANAGVAGLTLSNQRFVAALSYSCQSPQL